MPQEKEKKKIHMFLWLHQEMIVWVLLHLMNVSFCKTVQFLFDSLNYRWAASAQRDSLWIAPAAAWDANHPLWREEKKKIESRSVLRWIRPSKGKPAVFHGEEKLIDGARSYVSVVLCVYRRCGGGDSCMINWMWETSPSDFIPQ